MGSVEDGHVEQLTISSIIGFDGSAIGGLNVHPDGVHLVYPLGNKVTILNWNTNEQHHLCGHTNIISAIDLSRTGKYVASGQINHIGFKALVFIWDFKTRTIIGKHEVHKVRVESVAFSKDELFLLSLGGRDCCTIIVWDILNKKALCSAIASKETQGEATVVCPTNLRGPCFVTAGDGNLTVWRIDAFARKLVGQDVNVSKLKRTVLCMAMHWKDEYMYCGTSTGDIFKVRMNYTDDLEVLDPARPPLMIGCYAKINQSSKKNVNEKIVLYSMGVRAMVILLDDTILIGSGDGRIDSVCEIKKEIKAHFSVKEHIIPKFKVIRTTSVNAIITSLVLQNQKVALVGTMESEVIIMNLETFELKLYLTCHTSTIYDVAFPHQFSDVFATASKNDVRVWHLEKNQEILRIKVPNFCCSSVLFTRSGQSIITGWNDGIIRAFTPRTGKIIFEIKNAHNKGVSALAMAEDDKTLISGGCEGQVRIWEITSETQKLFYTLKEHKGPVSAIHINLFNDEAVSASTDGTCIIWDIIRYCRKQILFANTLFMCVKYYPNGAQILTGGSDRKISYWEVLDGTMIREQEGSTSAAINALDISPDGTMFVTGGNDQIIKLWKYQEGVTTHIGLGHAAVITAILFSPDGKKIISTSAAGSIFIWNSPYDLSKKEPDIPEDAKQKCLEQKDPKQKSLKLQAKIEALKAKQKLSERPHIMHSKKDTIKAAENNSARSQKSQDAQKSEEHNSARSQKSNAPQKSDAHNSARSQKSQGTDKSAGTTKT